ncbi:MAG: hypothetical protein ACXWRE_02790, partial [Pseudobdellovibrionaceae bacterium]
SDYHLMLAAEVLVAQQMPFLQLKLKMQLYRKMYLYVSYESPSLKFCVSEDSGCLELKSSDEVFQNTHHLIKHFVLCKYDENLKLFSKGAA